MSAQATYMLKATPILRVKSGQGVQNQTPIASTAGGADVKSGAAPVGFTGAGFDVWKSW
jgi:hypothetical protein